MRFFNHIRNFVYNIEDRISENIYDYHLRKEYKKIEEEGYKDFYVCNVSTIQSSENVFLIEHENAFLVWRGSKEFFRRFCLDTYISEFGRLDTEFYQLLTNGNFWLVDDLHDAIVSELCVDFDYRCYKFKNRVEYEEFVSEMNKAIKEELPKFGKNSRWNVFDFFEIKLNEKYRRDGFKYFRV